MGKDTLRKESTNFNILSLLWIQRIVAWKEQIGCGAHTKTFPAEAIFWLFLFSPC